MSQAAFGKDCCGGRARGEGGVHGCARTRTWEEEGSGADPDLGRAGGPLHLCGCGGSWGERGVPLAAALRRTAEGGAGGGATWEEGAEVALSLAERAAPSACVCVLRGGGGGAWVTNNIAKERDGWCARGEGCAHGCWEGGGGGEGVHGLTVLRFCPKAQSLARRLTALMGQWALGESADRSGITF